MTNDLISRQAAIDAIGEKSDEIYKTKQKGATYPHDDFFQGMAYAENVVKQLPPIQPKRGRWIKLDMHRGMADHKCSVCEQECYVPTCMGEPMYAYCPNCGAMMRGESE